MDFHQLQNLLKIESCIEDIEREIHRVVDAKIIWKHIGDQNINFANANQVVSMLDEKFLEKFPVIIAKVVIDETLIPPDIQVLINKKKYRVKGEIWVVHNNDADPFPSSPHAHNYDQNLVMHLGNGRMYRKRDYVATANRKAFLALREKINHVQLPPLEFNA